MARMLTRGFAWGVLIVVLLAGCNTMRQIAGLPVQAEPTIDLKSAEPRWLLIKYPRFGDVPSEPEYIWVEEDRIPTTLTTLLRGKSAIIASPEIVARYGTPPGGGKVSPRQQVPYAAAPPPTRQDATRPASSANASKMANVVDPILSANQMGVVFSWFASSSPCSRNPRSASSLPGFASRRANNATVSMVIAPLNTLRHPD